MTVQIVEIAGQKMAMLPVADYERLIDLAEDKADIFAAFESENRRKEGEEFLPAEMVDRILSGESALKVWRKHRSLSLEELGFAVGVTKGYLSQIENGISRGNPSLWRKLAEALKVSADDILPEG